MSVSHVLPFPYPICHAQCLEHFPPLAICVFTYRYPRTQQRSGGQRSQLRSKAGACSWPCQCGHAYPCVSQYPFSSIFPSLVGGVGSEISYWTMSARMGALKTLGRGWVFWLAAPSAPMMVTVGRDILSTVWLVGTVRRPAIVDSTARLGSSKVHFAPTANVCLACARGRGGTSRGNKLGIRCCD